MSLYCGESGFDSCVWTINFCRSSQRTTSLADIQTKLPFNSKALGKQTKENITRPHLHIRHILDSEDDGEGEVEGDDAMQLDGDEE
ncbi:hypothetical protein M404DRAFT_1008827 [Pisolithus tinctorius Marx 270]|uniref:Uncharacterized protein n=1 Tax=Pisolithus tinctorius Marx 270 TaxID=870435 RepID=A0A0C3I923_PISTI|nr:hypothetical protein M404DRAFT_1008827 [Pisolithus tinctorius Marx 270]